MNCEADLWTRLQNILRIEEPATLPQLRRWLLNEFSVRELDRELEAMRQAGAVTMELVGEIGELEVRWWYGVREFASPRVYISTNELSKSGKQRQRLAAGERRQVMVTQTKPCPGGCSHCDAEHRAFDAGLEAGRTIGETAENPYAEDDGLWWDWADGCAYGVILKEADEVAELKRMFGEDPHEDPRRIRDLDHFRQLLTQLQQARLNKVKAHHSANCDEPS